MNAVYLWSFKTANVRSTTLYLNDEKRIYARRSFFRKNTIKCSNELTIENLNLKIVSSDFESFHYNAVTIMVSISPFDFSFKKIQKYLIAFNRVAVKVCINSSMFFFMLEKPQQQSLKVNGIFIKLLSL